MKVISQALGGGSKEDTNEDVQVVESWEQLVGAFTGVGGTLG